MKIVQTFWSHPIINKVDATLDSRFSGGWFEKKYNYISWALSCLQFNKFYDNIELVTDKLGYELLINKIGLPYTSVIVKLDNLKQYNPSLWALGKIFTYSLQNEQFIHADGDVFIWEKFPERIEKAQLISQNLENGFPIYYKVLEEIDTHFNYIPSCISLNRRINKNINAYNAGIIGGKNYKFFKAFAEEVFNFINNNSYNIHLVNTCQLNIIFEQYLYYCLANEKKINVECLLVNIDQEFSGLQIFENVPKNTKFIHIVGGYKKEEKLCKNMANRLRLESPEFYYKINYLLSNNLI